MFHMFIVNKFGEYPCAYLFRDVNFNNWMRNVVNGENILWIENRYNDAVSSVMVTRGCTLVGYRHHNKVGRIFTTNTNLQSLGSDNNVLSSAACWCQKCFPRC